MKTLQEWAKYYQKLGIWVLPCEQGTPRSHGLYHL